MSFLYGQDTSERFKYSTIFGNFKWNTNSVNISDEQSGNSGQGTSSDIDGCSKNLIHDATENLSTADGGSADIEMSEDESITSGSIASGAEVQDIQTNKPKRLNKKTRDRMKRQENAKRLLKSTVDNDQSRGVPNDTEDTNIETGGKKADSNVEIQNKDKDGMSCTNNNDKSNKDNDNKNNKENDYKSNNNKSSKDKDNKSESKIDQKGATSLQHGNNENRKTTVQSDTGKEKKKTEASKTEKISKTDKKHSSGNEESKKNCTGKSKNQPDIKKNKNEANNSSKGSQPNSSGKTNDKGNACPSNKPQVLLEKSH